MGRFSLSEEDVCLDWAAQPWAEAEVVGGSGHPLGLTTSTSSDVHEIWMEGGLAAL